jgi:hypothetical protein
MEKFVKFYTKKPSVNYIYINIYNKTDDYNFTVYRSNSELGVLRFSSVDVGDHIFKGNHYVTTTSVHHLLQTYIFDIFEKIPINTNIDEELNALTLIPSNIISKYSLSPNITHLNYINDNRIYLNKYLNIFIVSTCGVSWFHFNNIFRYLLILLIFVFKFDEDINESDFDKNEDKKSITVLILDTIKYVYELKTTGNDDKYITLGIASSSF